MRNLLTFDSMITPKIITFVYWAMLAGIALLGLTWLGSALTLMSASPTAGLGIVVADAIGMLIAALFARIYCEVMIVLFKILETLQQIRDR